MQKTITASATKEWMTIKSAAASTGYNPEYIRQLVRAGQVAARKEGVAIRIDPASLDYYQLSRRDSTRRGGALRNDKARKNRSGVTQKIGETDPRLTSDPYLTDAVVRKHRNSVVIAHLDSLRSATPAEAKEQKETYQFLRKSLDQDRLSDRKRFRSNSTGTKAQKDTTA